MTIDPWRVAQIIVERRPGGENSRGSGYLVAPGRVLTAAHVVAGAHAVRVRLDVGQDAEIDEWAESWWADPAGYEGTDLAVITILESASAGRSFERAQFGRMEDCDAVLPVEAVGFPLFKSRDGEAGKFRDLERVSGHAPVAANRRQGTLAVYLDDPPPAQSAKGEPSPWEGMSGGPVWAGGRIVAVAAEHYFGEGAGRLTARRIDRAYETLPPGDLHVLAELLGLPVEVGGLPDIIPQEPGRVVRSAYLAQIREMFPGPLVGRDNELAEWAEFCAGTDAYTWWQAGPWAGKSALAAWFVLHPPAGTDVVSFFITGRFSGQADSDSFLDAMIEQLSSLSPAGGRGHAVAGSRAGAWWDLLGAAAAESSERGRRLVVVVDGLDEDDAGTTPSRGRPSIASLLPHLPPPGARFIVTSRPDPGLPDDLSEDHPLRLCAQHRLSTSAVAMGIERFAKQELQNLFNGEQIMVDVIGCIAGSGGGLSRSDLEVLIGVPPRRLTPFLRGVSGRSLRALPSQDPRDSRDTPATRIYLFAHDTLRVSAQEQLGTELDRYRQKVHDWMGAYASSSWPETTPGYAIRGYPGLLKTTEDVARLSALARDPHRHTFLFDATGSDNAALAEIETVQNLIAARDTADLRALVELAAYRLAISLRSKSIPEDLMHVWARLGRFDHAEALARAVTDSYEHVRVFADLVTTIAETGDLGRAESVACAVIDPNSRALALADLVTALAQAGDLDRAESVARTITDPRAQARALASLVAVTAQAGDLDRAQRLAADTESLARAVTDLYSGAWALADSVAALAQAGDLDRAESVARTITDPRAQARALASLVGVTAQAGDLDRAYRLAADTEALVLTITETFTNVGAQFETLTALVTAFAQTGDLDRAESAARTFTKLEDQARALAGLVAVAAQVGDLGRAYRLAVDIEALARTITEPKDQVMGLAKPITAFAQAGDPDRAYRLAVETEALARTITEPKDEAWALHALALAIAEAGDIDRAEALALTITDPDVQASALGFMASVITQTGDLDRAEALLHVTDAAAPVRTPPDLIAALARAGNLDRAEALTRTIIDPTVRASELSRLANVTAQVGDLDRAYRLAADTEGLARTITDPHAQAQALHHLIGIIARTGDFERAEALARTMTDPSSQVSGLTDLVGIIARTGDFERAEALARTITDPRSQAWALCRIVTMAEKNGNLDRAETLARAIPDAHVQASVLGPLVAAVAQSGDLDRAGALVRAISDTLDRASALGPVVAAVAQSGDLGRAEALARAIPDAGPRAWALASLATVIAQSGDLDRTYRLIADTEAAARTITDAGAQAQILSRLVTVIAEAGDLNRAESLARTITNPVILPFALNNLIDATAKSGDFERAEALARTIPDFNYRNWALVGLVSAIAQAGDLNQAEIFARTITDPGTQASALSRLVTMIAETGDLDRAEALALNIARPDESISALVDLITAATRTGDVERAARLMPTVLIMDRYSRYWMKTVAECFPAAVGDSWNIIAGACAGPTRD